MRVLVNPEEKIIFSNSLVLTVAVSHGGLGVELQGELLPYGKDGQTEDITLQSYPFPLFLLG